MPPPATTPELLDRLRHSGLVPAADLDAFLAESSADAGPPQLLLDRLVAAQLLTPFHAERLAAGKYKGFRLGSYLILDKIGTGGMGQVFLAEHADMHRLVAVKVLPGIGADDAVARERFLREARAAAALDHPNIIRVFDLNRDGRLMFLVMEYVEGLSLQALVTQRGPLPVAVAADYVRQVALGLQHAHERGLIHRDVKPGNVLIDRWGGAKLLDLGLVRLGDDSESKLTAQIGGNRGILGTADYLAPEQAVDSSKVDIRADIYSLGATLYFALAGHPLFPDGRTAQKLMWQQWKEPTPVRQLRPDVPEELAAVLATALAKKRDDRFATPQAVADLLAPFARGPAPPDPAVIPVPPVRKVSVRPGADGDPGSSVRMREATATGRYRLSATGRFDPLAAAAGSSAVVSHRDSVRPPHESSADTPLPAGRMETPAIIPLPPARPADPSPAVVRPSLGLTIGIAAAAGGLAAAAATAAGFLLFGR